MTAILAASVDGSYGSLSVSGKESFRFGADTSGQPLSFRNKILNRDFNFWQRGVISSEVGYLADRWRMDGLGTTFTARRIDAVPGNDVTQYNTKYHLRVAVNSVAGAPNYAHLSQRIENVETLSGQKAVLSFWARADSPKSLAVSLVQYFGTGGTPSPHRIGISPTKINLTAAYQRFSVPLNIPSIAGMTRGTAKDDFLAVLFWMDAGSSFDTYTAGLGQQSGWFDFGQVQLEAGTIASPFEALPESVELPMCKRYYNRIAPGYSGFAYAAGMGITPTTCESSFSFTTQMRAAPVLEHTGVAGDYAIQGSVCAAVPVLTGASSEHVVLRFTGSAAMTTGTTYLNMANSVGSFIAFNSEL